MVTAKSSQSPRSYSPAQGGNHEYLGRYSPAQVGNHEYLGRYSPAQPRQQTCNINKGVPLTGQKSDKSDRINNKRDLNDLKDLKDFSPKETPKIRRNAPDGAEILQI